MPKGPINERTTFFSRLPGGEGGYMFLDWNVVETALGTMVEPRMLSPVPVESSVADVNAFDTGWTRIRELDENVFYTQNFTGGHQLPRDFVR